jgi:hypothetical protein
MLPHKFLLAIALLTGSDPLNGVEDSGAVFKSLAPTLRQVAIGWQILDRREADEDILAKADHFAEDLELLQKRLLDYSGAPAVAECERLPERDLISQYINLNRAYHKELSERLQLDQLHSEEIRAALQETEQLFHIWDTVRDARCKYYYVTVRRQALQELRELVGAEAYYRGELPPPLPVWRVPRMR